MNKTIICKQQQKINKYDDEIKLFMPNSQKFINNKKKKQDENINKLLANKKKSLQH